MLKGRIICGQICEHEHSNCDNIPNNELGYNPDMTTVCTGFCAAANVRCRIILHPLRYERVYLPLRKVADTPFQGDEFYSRQQATTNCHHPPKYSAINAGNSLHSHANPSENVILANYPCKLWWEGVINRKILCHTWQVLHPDKINMYHVRLLM